MAKISQLIRYKKIIIGIFFGLLFPPVLVFAAPLPNTPFKISNDGRFLIRENGTPLFILTDTAWALLADATNAEADEYLRIRKEQGFTTITTTLIWNMVQPFNGGDISRPFINSFWVRMDYILNKAAQEGLTINLVPVWGQLIDDKVVTTNNAKELGKFIGNRYKNLPITWMLGGDHDPRSEEAVYQELADGIVEGAAGVGGHQNVLFTYQTDGTKSSTDYFANASWLDFSTTHPGHCDLPNVYLIVEREFARSPVRPALSGEAVFEHLPICFNLTRGVFDDQTTRRSAYTAAFAGATGFTYGGYETYILWDGIEAPRWGAQNYGGVTTPWPTAIRFPGAEDMQHLRSLIESRPMLTRIPDQSMLISSVGNGFNRVQVARASDGAYAFIYTAYGDPLTINTSNLSGSTLNAWWYNPRLGSSLSIGTQQKTASSTFTPPTRGVGNDWVLVIDDSSRNFPAPGTRASTFSSTCGNGIIEGIEQCDGSNVGGASCQSRGYFSGTLSCSSSCTFTTSQCLVEAPAPLEGDIDSNRAVGDSDWVYMRTHWGTNNTLADINRDGVVNSIDFSYLNKNWGRTQ